MNFIEAIKKISIPKSFFNVKVMELPIFVNRNQSCSKIPEKQKWNSQN